MAFKKIMLTGLSGQVGHALFSSLSDVEVVGLTRKELDLTDGAAITRVIRQIKPDLIIHPAAYTAVDKAESEPKLAHAINAEAPKTIAEEAARLGAALIHFSTDYVYDGTKDEPYVETDSENPTSVYGKTKLTGEQAIIKVGLPHLILRTSWVYGAYGQNFLKTILRLASEREQLSIVADQYGAPTSSQSIAQAVCDLVKHWKPEAAEQTGVYHMTNSGRTSWHGFAQDIIKRYVALDKAPALTIDINNVQETTSDQYPTAASRPENSCLDNAKLKRVFDVALPSWQHGLEDVMQHL